VQYVEGAKGEPDDRRLVAAEVGLVLTSRDGNRKLALSPDGQYALKLSDQSGRILWSAP